MTEPSRVNVGGTMHDCIIETASLSQAALKLDVTAPRLGETVHLRMPGAGWTDARVVGSNRNYAMVDLVKSPAQHRALVAWLFSTQRDNIARQASMLGALIGVFRRRPRARITERAFVRPSVAGVSNDRFVYAVTRPIPNIGIWNPTCLNAVQVG